MNIVKPEKEIVLILTSSYLPQGVTTAREGIKKLMGNGGIRAMGFSGALYSDWEAWASSQDFFDSQPSMRSVSREWPVPTILVANIAHIKRAKIRTPSLKHLYEYFDGVCQICFKRFPKTKMSVEHIYPRSHGGSNNYDNISLTCKKCNTHKSNKKDFTNNHGAPIKHWRPAVTPKIPALRDEWKPFLLF